MSTKGTTTSAASDKEAAKHRQATPAAPQEAFAPISAAASPLVVQRAVADPSAARPSEILALQRQYGNQTVVRLLDSHGVQPKLNVGPAGDQYEQEADRVAQQVLTMPAAPATPVQRTGEAEEDVQTKPLAGAITARVQRAPEEEEEVQTKPLMQRQAGEAGLQTRSQDPREGFEAGHVIEDQLQAQQGGGSSLPGEVRSFMEPRFGADFSGVRLHTGSEAAQLNRQLSAQAFTHGQDIYLGTDNFSPSSEAGKGLLAHELTHVVQQTGSAVQRAALSRVSPADRQALLARLPSVQRSAESGAALGQTVDITHASSPDRIHRCGGGKKGKGGEMAKTDQTAKTGETAKTVPENDTGEVAKTKPTVPQHPPAPKSQIDHAGGQKILKDAFGTVKEIVRGKIEILDQDAFKAAYDAIYNKDGHGQYGWDVYVVPTFGSLNGFAHAGTNYINRATAGLHTVVHEMLHNNVAADWRGVVGSEWDEGTTEVLTMEACGKANEPAPMCYPGQTPVIREAISQGLSLADLTEAYLKGGAQAKIADWADAQCKQNWSAIKGFMQQKNFNAAKAALEKK